MTVGVRPVQGAEDVFDMLACYFPLVFTPPAGDPDAVSREALVRAPEVPAHYSGRSEKNANHLNKKADIPRERSPLLAPAVGDRKPPAAGKRPVGSMKPQSSETFTCEKIHLGP